MEKPSAAFRGAELSVFARLDVFLEAIWPQPKNPMTDTAGIRLIRRDLLPASQMAGPNAAIVKVSNDNNEVFADWPEAGMNTQ